MKGYLAAMLSVFVLSLMIFSALPVGTITTHLTSNGPCIMVYSTKGKVLESEGNDLTSTADPFTTGTPADPLLINGTLSSATDVDWFKITVAGPNPGILNVSLTTPVNASTAVDYTFSVYEANDATGAKLFMEASDPGYANSAATGLTAWAAGPGFYFMRVKVKDLTTQVEIKEYWLNVSWNAKPNMKVESEILNKTISNDDPITANSMDLTGTGMTSVDFFGTIRSSTDMDWFWINLTGPSAGVLNISFETFYGDISGAYSGRYLRMMLYGPTPCAFDTTHQMLTGNDYGSASPTLIKGTMVPVGDYRMQIDNPDGASESPYQPYHLAINFTPARTLQPAIQLESELIAYNDSNNDEGNASSLQLTLTGALYNGTIYGNIDGLWDSDWINFTLPGTTVGNLTLILDTPYDAAASLNPTYYYVFYRSDNMTSEFLNASNQGSAGEYTETLVAVRATTYYVRVFAGVGSMIRYDPYVMRLSFSAGCGLPIEKEHADGTLNNWTNASEVITMVPPGDGKSYHRGHIYGSLDNTTDQDYYTFEFADAYVGELRVFVKTPNYKPSTAYSYEIYGPDGFTYRAAYKYQYGAASEEQFTPTIPGGLPGKYLLRVCAPGYFDAAHLYYVRIEFEPLDTAPYQVAGKIYGIVSNNFTSQPIENITVNVDGRDQYSNWQTWGGFKSDVLGNYTTCKLPKQEVRVRVTTNGYAEFTNITTMAVGVDQKIDIKLVPTYGSLSGRAWWGTPAYADKWVPFADVEVLGTSLKTKADKDGYYSFAQMPTGFFSVRFSAEYFLPDTRDVTIIESEASTLNGYLTGITGGVIVTLKDQVTGINITDATLTMVRAPFQNVSLYFSNWMGLYYTYGYDGLLVGNYTMHLVHSEYGGDYQVKIEQGKFVFVNMTLFKKIFHVTVKDKATGSALGQYSVIVKLYSTAKATVAAGMEYTTLVQDAIYESGYWKFTGISNGDYYLNVTDYNWPTTDGAYLPYEEMITFGNESIDETVELVKPGVLVNVTDALTGMKVTEATVTLRADLETTSYTLYDSYNLGMYSTQQLLPAGGYSLSVEHYNYQSYTTHVTISGAVSEFSAQLTQGEMRIELFGELYQNQNNQIIAYVYDDATDLALQYVKLWDSVNQDSYSYSTDASGKTTIMIYPTTGTTEVMFQASLSKYRTTIKNLTVITGAAPTTGIIQGKVWDGSSGFSGIKVDLYKGTATSMWKIVSDKEDAALYNSTTTGTGGTYMFTGVEFPAGDQQIYSVCISPHQDKRPYYYWGSSQDFTSVTVGSTDRFKSDINIQVQANNPPTFTERTITDGNQYDPYNNVKYEQAKLDSATYKFVIWVEDSDNDEPEYVRLQIAGKTFNMKPMKYTNTKYTAGDPDTKLSPMNNPGRYYEVALELGDIKAGKYDYTFVVRDVWASTNTTKQSTEKLEVEDLRAVVLKDSIVNFAVQGVLALLLLIATIVAYVITKKKYSYSENKNKDLTTYGMNHTLQTLDPAAVGDKANDLNEARRQYIEGKISAEEFVKKLKG